MRVVLDTNVLLAAFISRGVCHDLLEHCVRQHEVVLSDFLLAQLRRKLQTKLGRKLLGKFRVPAERVGRADSLLRSEATIVQIAPLPAPVCRDPDDDWVLSTAVAGGCRCVVTGDKDLLTLGDYEGIRILRPAAFWALE